MRMQFPRGFGPSIARQNLRDVLRAGAGALFGFALLALAFAGAPDLRTGLFLIAPFGASAVLVFAAPNSPLAQPWSVVVGNTVAALVGVAACFLIDDTALRVALAVSLAIAAMLAFRALHPPGGAVAMTAALAPDLIHEIGFRFVLTPVAAGSAALVLAGLAWARATGRHYPLRQMEVTEPPPTARVGLSEGELNAILQSYRQSLNLGAADLARLIGAAEMQVASHHSGAMTAGDIMSRDLVTVDPDTPIGEVAELFRRHGFTSIPVVQQGDKFLGVIFQIHLIRRAREDALRLDRGFGAAMARLTGRREHPVRAGDIMGTAMPRALRTTPVAALLPMMAEGHCDAVPVLDRGRIIGIVTRTDMIAALARRSLSG